MDEHVLVDTNVLLDVLNSDPEWGDWSEERMSQFPNRLVINPIIYTELCYMAAGVGEVESAVEMLGLIYRDMPKEALFLASQAFRIYRTRGGTKTAPLADFFIGAHAQASHLPILTRDMERYRAYFPGVRLIVPVGT
jgi:predicted nucleic acid-binding protein